jgi:hypothetical protein
LVFFVSGEALAQRRVGAVLKSLYPQEPIGKARFVKGDRRNRITFGHEAEFSIENAPGMLKWFRPRNKTDKGWKRLSVARKLQEDAWGMVPTAAAPPELKQPLSSDPGGAERWRLSSRD